MKQTVNFSSFVDAFHAHDRYAQFGYVALRVLFDYLEEMEEDTGNEMELDVIALCCDYSVDSWQDLASEYSIDLDDCEDDDERVSAVLEYLEGHTSVCGTVVDGDGAVTHVVYCSAF